MPRSIAVLLLCDARDTRPRPSPCLPGSPLHQLSPSFTLLHPSHSTHPSLSSTFPSSNAFPWTHHSPLFRFASSTFTLPSRLHFHTPLSHSVQTLFFSFIMGPFFHTLKFPRSLPFSEMAPRRPQSVRCKQTTPRGGLSAQQPEWHDATSGPFTF